MSEFSELPAFLGEPCAPEEAGVTILPVPFERTTSYGSGTARGPAAILEASGYVELWDEELRCEPHRIGVHTAEALLADDEALDAAVASLQRGMSDALGRGNFVLTLGGEHTVTVPAVRAWAERAEALGEPFGVVQFDAHADLRDEYEDTPLSHACVMRRVLETGAPILPIGIRSLSTPEAELIDRDGIEVVWADELEGFGPDALDARLANLPDSVYLTFDVDFFDPSLVPATGTPEPGGGSWWPTLRLLRRLFESKRVVAMDIVELAPDPHHHASNFLVAKLALKCIAYHARGRGLL